MVRCRRTVYTQTQETNDKRIGASAHEYSQQQQQPRYLFFLNVHFY